MPLSKRMLREAVVERVLADLSPRMREALDWLPGDGSIRIDDPQPRGLWSIATRDVCEHTEARLARQTQPPRHDSKVGWHGAGWQLTSLGIEVQRRMREQHAESFAENG